MLAGEVTVAGLACDGEQYFSQSWLQAASLVTSPPVREGQADGLITGLSDGRLQLVSSHHAAYNSQQRALGRNNFQEIPKGVTGVEERLVLVWVVVSPPVYSPGQ